jgi:hypothetical protein
MSRDCSSADPNALLKKGATIESKIVPILVDARVYAGRIVHAPGKCIYFDIDAVSLKKATI